MVQFAAVASQASPSCPEIHSTWMPEGRQQPEAPPTSNLLVIVTHLLLAVPPQKVLAVLVQRPALDAVLQALASALCAASPPGCGCAPALATAGCAVLQLQQDALSGLSAGPAQRVRTDVLLYCAA